MRWIRREHTPLYPMERLWQMKSREITVSDIGTVSCKSETLRNLRLRWSTAEK